MTDQFSYPHARSDDPDTSHDGYLCRITPAGEKYLVCT